MTFEFDFQNIDTLEFGVGRDQESERTFCFIQVDDKVQDALKEMVITTRDRMYALTHTPELYQPAEKHGSQEYLYLPLADGLSTAMRNLHAAHNLETDSQALRNHENLFCYFTYLTDHQDRRLTALRRSQYFKGVIDKKLMRFTSDALTMLEDRVFKLDVDFDLLIDSQNIHILRPSGFEFAGQLKQAVLDAVPSNVSQIQREMSFMDFGNIEDYAKKHPRAARYIASIKSQGGTHGINEDNLKACCADTGVEIVQENGQIRVGNSHIMGFLEVLDRRRYRLELIDGQPEQYRAASRSKLA